MQKSYESLWEGVKRFFSFRFLLGVRIAEILYFIGFVLITVYGIRILAFLISDDRFYRNCFGFLPRGQLITAVLILFPIAHLVWRMFLKGTWLSSGLSMQPNQLTASCTSWRTHMAMADNLGAI